MKKLIKILLSLYILFLIPSASIAQQGIQQKQFPQIPEHPVKRPAPQQHLGYLEFQNEHPDWSVHWSIKSGVPRSILGLPISMGGGPPEVIARRFLNQNRTIFNMAEGLTDLRLVEVQNLLRATHVVFRQTFSEIPVLDALYAVHLTKDGKVYLANGDYFDDVSVPSVIPAISSSDAVSIASTDLGPSLRLRSAPESELTILPYGDEFHLIWKIVIPADEPFGQWEYFISAEDGNILGGMNKIKDHIGTVNVFERHPETGSNNIDDASKIKALTGVVSVFERHPEAGSTIIDVVSNLTGTGWYLTGTDISVFNNEPGAGPATELDGVFIYDPEDTHFDEVMVYYHAEKYREDFLGGVLGYPYIGFPGAAAPVTAIVHVQSLPNNASAIYPRTLYFGDGDGSTRNNTSKENNIIYHEYQHLVTNFLAVGMLDDNPATNFNETNAMDEAFSDFFAASFDGSPILGEYFVVGPSYLRSVSNNFKMSDWDNSIPELFGPTQFHRGGQIFSGALWEIRQQYSNSTGEILAFEGLTNLDISQPDFVDARMAIIAADNALFGGPMLVLLKVHLTTTKFLFHPMLP